MYEKDTLNALDAITEAQRIAFAPMLFQTARCLRNSGVLSWLDKKGKTGASLEEITENSTLSSVSVLLDMGLSGRIVTCKEGRYFLAKVGHFLLHDTMTRVNIIKGLGPVLQIAEGWSVELPEDMHDQLDARTNSTWPTTWFAPRLTGKGPFSDVYSVMANWGANHGVLTIGHVGADFITLAAMLRIPVCMHNVEDEKIYRPSAWAAHGMDMEGQDYRACQNYGPLYKR